MDWYTLAYREEVRQQVRAGKHWRWALRMVAVADREERWALAHGVDPQKGHPPWRGVEPGHEGCDLCAAFSREVDG